MKNLVLHCMTVTILISYGVLYAGPCDELKQHEDYWKVMQGGVDLDPAKGNRLKAECDIENPCYQLQRHDLYWSLPSRGGDHDPARRAYLEEKCTPGAAARREADARNAENAKQAAVAEQKRQEDGRTALQEWQKHVEYWIAHGNVDGDPLRGKVLYDAARSFDSQKADAIKARAPKNVFEHAGQFLKDLTEGRIPEDFKLKGLLSSQVNKIPPILDATAQAVAEIPKGFITMYTELGIKKYDIQNAINGIVDGKSALVTSSKETEANPLVPQELKDDLMKGFDQTAKTLPEIEKILQELYGLIDTLIPTAALEVNETVDQFSVKVKDAAFAKTNQEIQPYVNAVLGALSRQIENYTLSQSIAAWGRNLNDKNL